MADAAWLTIEIAEIVMYIYVPNYDPAVDFSNAFHFENFFFCQSPQFS